MRFVAYALFVAGAALGQNMTDFAAAAVGGTVGGASGKKVSDGITAVLGKVGEQSVKAAGKEETASPALKLGPGTPKADAGGVPPPPPPSGRRSPMAPPNMSALAQVSIPPEVTRIFTLADVAPVLPPPPEMSPEDLKTVTSGMSRAQILKFGAPASKITMYEDGHVLEIYSYREKGQRFGTVRLNNGTVASVEQP